MRALVAGLVALSALVLPVRPAAAAPTVAVALLGFDAAGEVEGVRAELGPRLSTAGATLLDPIATAAGLRAFLPGPAAEARDEALAELRRQLGVEELALVRVLARDDAKAVLVLHLRVVDADGRVHTSVRSSPSGPAAGGVIAEVIRSRLRLAVAAAEPTPTPRAAPPPSSPPPSAPPATPAASARARSATVAATRSGAAVPAASTGARSAGAPPPPPLVLGVADSPIPTLAELRALASEGGRLARAGKPAEAEKVLRYCLERSPAWGPCAMGLAAFYAQRGDLEASYRTYRCFLDASPDGPNASEVREILSRAPPGVCDTGPGPGRAIAAPTAAGGATSASAGRASTEVRRDATGAVREVTERSSGAELGAGGVGVGFSSETLKRVQAPPSTPATTGILLGGSLLFGDTISGQLGSFSLRFRNVYGQFPGVDGGPLHAFDLAVNLGAVAGRTITEVEVPRLVGTTIQTELQSIETTIAGGQATLELAYLFVSFGAMDPESLRQRGFGLRVGVQGGARMELVVSEGGGGEPEISPIVGPILGLELPGYNAGTASFSSVSVLVFVLPLPSLLSASASLALDF